MKTEQQNTLTPCQREVFEYLAWGETYKEIANRLNKSVRTVINLARLGCERLNIYPSQIPSWWFCTNFNISFELSPVKRKVGATFLVLLFGFEVAVSNENVIRRTRRTRSIQEIEYRTES